MRSLVVGPATVGRQRSSGDRPGEPPVRTARANRNDGGRFPHGRVTVNLAPADLKKAGPTYDLPIALGILVATKQVPNGSACDELADALLVGELSLDGVLRHTPGPSRC